MENDTSPLPFGFRELRDAIPDHCFQPSTVRSLLHLAFDVGLLGLLYAASAAATGTGWLVPIVLAQGTMCWAIFVLGHDCGHGAFSRQRGWNEWVGHLTHTPLLVPYHGWRLSHRRHHRHTGDIDRDEAWPPLTHAEVEAMPAPTRLLRFRGFLFVFPLYLLRNGPNRAGSHFDPSGPLFPAAGRRKVRRSVGLCIGMALLLAAFAGRFGGAAFAQYWLAPYAVFAVWAALVTYLHHTDPGVPWYRGGGWSPLRGALATVERRYGLIEWLHHDAGCHVIHHLFPRVPHYRLREAAAAIEPILGPHLRRADASVLVSLWRAARDCEVVPETGDRVYYERRGTPPPVEDDAAWAVPSGGAGSSPATRW